MIGRLRVLALIPARGGSKGLPGKNLRVVGGRPLLGWTAEAARRSRYVDRVVLSTDDDDLMEAGRAAGCDVPFRRPAGLATDEAPTSEVVLHALRELPGYDFVVLLQPTSPLRTADDVDAALVHCVDSGAPSCVSISPAPHSPYWMYFMNQDTTLRSVLEAPPGATRRQDLPPAYALNGAIYVASVPWFQAGRSFVTAETVAYVMPEERSIDIDTASDLESFRRTVEGNPSGQVPAAP